MRAWMMRAWTIAIVACCVGCAGGASNDRGDGGVADGSVADAGDARPDASALDAGCSATGDAEVLACGLEGPTSLAVTEGWAYWGTLSGRLERLAGATGERALIFDDPAWSVDEVRAAKGRVVWLVSEGSRAALWSAEGSSSVPARLTSAAARPYEFAVGEGAVYFLQIGAGIRQVSLADGTERELYSVEEAPGVTAALAVVRSEIVWVQNTRSATVSEALVWRGPIDGSGRPSAVSLGAPGNAPASITADDRAVYVCTTACRCGRPLGDCCVDRVFELPHDAPGAPRELYSGGSVCLSLVAGGGGVFLVEYRAIVRIDPASGTTTTFAPAAIPTSMQVDDGYLYWVDRRGTPDLVRADGLLLRQPLP